MASENSLVRLIQSLTVQLDLWTLLLLERRIRPANSFRPPANLVAVLRFLSPGHVESDIAPWKKQEDVANSVEPATENKI